MNQERWRQIEDVFHRVLAARDEERARLLDEICASDAELHREASILLASASDDGVSIRRVLAAGLDDLATAARPSSVDRRLGRYRLRALLGEGGMGAVYLADRDDGQFAQQVAIKILPYTVGSQEAIARFRNERQILATLEHRNIVRLLDGGNTDDGLPYLVMEYIEGNSITAFAANHSLSMRERVKLVRDVCAAIQYAHQHLIIHRDIKPSNILVDEEGTPKLLDFGIAKLLAPVPSFEREAMTRTGQVLFTPDYASPEQARGEEVSTATDVYSIGAVLYELVTGQPPHRTTGNLLKSLRVVAPSERHRGLAGDLDSIILKALHEDPAQRYETIAQLADDLGRSLDGLPVKARDATLGYRARKFVGRNKAAVLATALVAIALVVSTVISFRQATRAKRANDELLLQNAKLLLQGDPTAAVAALAGYQGEDEVRRQMLLAEAAGRGVAEAVLTPHSDTIWFLAGDADGTVFSLAEDRHIRVTKGTTSTTLASDVSTSAIYAYSPEKRLLAYARTPAGIAVIDLKTKVTTKIDTGTPRAMAIAADGSRLAALDSRGRLTVWSLSPTGIILEQDLPPGAKLIFADPSTLVVREQEALRVISLGLQEHGATVAMIPSTAADARIDEVVIGDESGTITLFSRALIQLAQLPVCHTQITSVRLAARANLVAFTCQDGVAGVARYDGLRGALFAADTFTTYAAGHDAKPDALGTRVVVAADSSTVYLYDVESRLVTRYEVQAGRVSFIAPPRPEFEHILVGDVNGTVRVWNLPPRDARLIFQAKGAVYSVAFSPDGQTMVTDGEDGVVRRVDIARSTVTELRGHEPIVRPVRFSLGGRSFLSVGRDRTVRIWSPTSERPMLVFSNHSSEIRDAEYIEGGRRVVSVGDDGQLLVWTPESGGSSLLFAHQKSLDALEILGDSGHVVVHDPAGAVWDVSTAGVVRQVRMADGATITMLRASPDGRLLAIGMATGTVVIYETNEYQVVKETAMKAGIRQISFDPQNRDLLIASENGRVRMLALDTRRTILWPDLEVAARDVAYDSDGQTIALVCEDGGGWFYSVNMDRWVYARDHASLVISGRFSPDGAHFASTDFTGRVILRDMGRTFAMSSM